MARKKHLINVHTSTGTGAPSGASLYLGEIAVQHTPNDPALWIKMGETEESEVYEKFIGQTEILNMFEDTKILGSGYTYDGIPYVNSSTTIADAYSALTNELLNDERSISESLNDLNDRVSVLESESGASEGLMELSASVVTNRGDIDEMDRVVSEALNDLNARVTEISGSSGEMDEILEYIQENEEAIAASLNDLNERVGTVETRMTGDYITLGGYELASGTTEEELAVNERDTVNEAFGKLQKQNYDNELIFTTAFNEIDERLIELAAQVASGSSSSAVSREVAELSASVISLYMDVDEFSAAVVTKEYVIAQSFNDINVRLDTLSSETKTHIEDQSVHVTSIEKAAWDGKQDAIPDIDDIRNNALSGVSAYTVINELSASVISGLNELSASVVTNSDEITSVSASVVTNHDEIASVSASVVTNSGEISSLSASVVSNSEDIIHVSASVVTNSEEITSLSASVVTNDEKITSLSASVVTNSEEITSLSASVVTNSEGLTSVSASVVTNADEIDSLSASVVTNSEEIAYLSSATVSLSASAITGITMNGEPKSVSNGVVNLGTVLSAETDPTVPSWAKEANKPSYTASEVGALPTGTTLDDVADGSTRKLSVFFDDAEYDSNTKRINFKNGGTVKNYIDATDFIKDGMVSSVTIQNGSMVITFNTDAGHEDIVLALEDIFDPDDYYTTAQTNANFLSASTTLDGIPDGTTRKLSDYATTTDVNALSSATHTHVEDSEIHVTSEDKTNWTNSGTSGANAYVGFIAHSANTEIHVTSSDKATWNGKQDIINDLSDIRNNALSGASAYTAVTELSAATTGIRDNALSGVSAYTGVTELSGAVSDMDYVLTQFINDLDERIDEVSSVTKTHIENSTIHVTQSDKANWNSKQGAISDLDAIRNNSLSGASAYTGVTALSAATISHVNDTTIHVTSSDKTTWSGKQDEISDLSDIRNNALSGASAYTGLNELSGVVLEKDYVIAQFLNNLDGKIDEVSATTEAHLLNTSVHVTAVEKTAWGSAYQNRITGASLTSGATNNIAIAGNRLNINAATLPSYSSSDNGKVLVISNGVPTWEAPGTIYYGSGIPPQGTGNDGDIYIQTS